MLWHIELKFCIWRCFTGLQIKFECCQFSLIFVGVITLLELRILKIRSFFSLSSYMLWHIELKFCIWLCFVVLKTKFKCHRFVSIIVGVITILEAKSRKYQGVFEVKSRVKTWQVRGIWSQQLEHWQVPKWGTEPGVRKGKRSLLASHTRCKCSMETTHNSVKVKL